MTLPKYVLQFFSLISDGLGGVIFLFHTVGSDGSIFGYSGKFGGVPAGSVAAELHLCST